MTQINETSVSLRFFGDDLEPDQVSLALGCVPDSGWRRGDTRNLKGDRKLVVRTGTWIKSIGGKRPGDLDAQIRELLSACTDDVEIWRSLTSSFRADVFCGLFLNEPNEGGQIAAQTLLTLGLRGLDLSFDIYAVGSDSADGD